MKILIALFVLILAGVSLALIIGGAQHGNGVAVVFGIGVALVAFDSIN